MAVITVNRTINGVFESASSATLSIRDAAGSVMLATTVVTPIAEGQYSYTSPALAPGNYTAIWTLTTAGAADDVLYRPFTVDAPIEVSEGIRLMDIERAVARQCGTYRRVKALTSSGSTNNIIANRLKSSQNLGSFETEFALRRGLYWNNTLIPGFYDDDRIRGIASYASSSGTLTVDQSYTLPVQADESIEIMYLDPEEELRVAVIDGLSRCFFWDTISVTPTESLGNDINLTNLVPWLSNPQWIKGMLTGPQYLGAFKARSPWWEPYRSGKNVLLRSTGAWPGSIQLTVLRPHVSFVNGETSFAGPNTDLDVLYMDLEYAVTAGVIAVWKNFPERISPVATQDMRIKRDEAAKEFTKKSMMIAGQIPERIQIDYGRYTLDQIGNLPEVVS